MSPYYVCCGYDLHLDRPLVDFSIYLRYCSAACIYFSFRWGPFVHSLGIVQWDSTRRAPLSLCHSKGLLEIRAKIQLFYGYKLLISLYEQYQLYQISLQTHKINCKSENLNVQQLIPTPRGCLMFHYWIPIITNQISKKMNKEIKRQEVREKIHI